MTSVQHDWTVRDSATKYMCACVCVCDLQILNLDIKFRLSGVSEVSDLSFTPSHIPTVLSGVCDLALG